MNRSISTRPGRMTALAAALLGACIQAQAAATPEQLGSIKLYADVTIAQDRVDRWGPWEEFEPPAAGPLGFIVADLGFQREPYRPLPTTAGTAPPVVLPPVEISARLCAAGSLCGYGVQQLVEGEVATGGTTLHLLTLDRATLVGPDGAPALGLTVRLDELPDGATETRQLTATSAEGNLTTYESADGSQAASLTLPANDANYVPDDGPNLELYSYLAGSEPSRQLNLEGVVGRVTGTAAMAALRTSNQQATYRGFDYHRASGSVGTVSMAVNFGSGTFTYATTGGVQSYAARGEIRGSGYVATSFVTPATTGLLQGNFVGANAAGTVGGASITQNGVTAQTVHATRRVADGAPQ